jgi:hypothetical protein
MSRMHSSFPLNFALVGIVFVLALFGYEQLYRIPRNTNLLFQAVNESSDEARNDLNRTMREMSSMGDFTLSTSNPLEIRISDVGNSDCESIFSYFKNHEDTFNKVKFTVNDIVIDNSDKLMDFSCSGKYATYNMRIKLDN